ncbi:MAG: argininosuccinate lyase [Chitinophagaceae bacterium]|nr:argininosuccinate lyase [Chitinophagaceae bacterium]
MSKLWQKNNKVLDLVEKFTIGNDQAMDMYLACYDVLGSIAHTTMLAEVGLLTAAEQASIKKALVAIYEKIQAGNFSLDPGVEDIHSQVEILLTASLGDAGKKIHSARSRNDQVLVDIKLFLRAELMNLTASVQSLFKTLQAKSEAHKNDLLPGYTHLQLAMPSSFGLWLGAYAESLVDDITLLQAAYKVVNKNPLGSAAGYGSSFPINRTRTTELLGFESLNYNVVYAQMGRGKAERVTAMAIANIADTLSKLSMDACLFMNQNFGFIQFPEALTTGSSIMPHKKNPDVFELIRSYCNRIKALPNEIMMMTTNLPSGYHRDLQLLKEHLFPAFTQLNNCIEMASLMIQNMEVKKDILEDPKYQYLFSVEEVNKLVLTGMPFRDAYKQVGAAIESGKFTYSTELTHTHEGSIGNLGTEIIGEKMKAVVAEMGFEKVEQRIAELLNI